MTYFTVDPRGLLIGGPFPAPQDGEYPLNAVVTDQDPPTPGEGQAVRHIGRGAWALVDDPGPISPPAQVGPDRIHRGTFSTDLLTTAENDVWIDLVDEAEQTPVASRTPTQKDVLRAWRHFTLHEYIDRQNVFTQTAVMALYVWGVLGPVYDDQSGVPPTEAELAAIARADRIGKFLPPE